MIPTETPRPLWPFVLVAVVVLGISSAQHRAWGAGCRLTLQGDGTVTEILDVRTIRLHDGREVRLTGIDAPESDTAAAEQALRQLVLGRAVTLHGISDTPDRYGRQPALVFTGESGVPVQAALLAAGLVVDTAGAVNAACAAELAAAETGARRTKTGIWSGSVIKNAKSPGDILTRIGRFAVVEGKVLSVRQAAAVTYINFGRRWTQDFAVTISRRALPLVEASGIPVKSLEGKTVQVRGWVGARGGPRIEVFRAGQIVIGDN